MVSMIDCRLATRSSTVSWASTRAAVQSLVDHQWKQRPGVAVVTGDQVDQQILVTRVGGRPLVQERLDQGGRPGFVSCSGRQTAATTGLPESGPVLVEHAGLGQGLGGDGRE